MEIGSVLGLWSGSGLGFQTEERKVAPNTGKTRHDKMKVGWTGLISTGLKGIPLPGLDNMREGDTTEKKGK